MWLGKDLRTDTKKHVFHRDWTTCSKCIDHYMLTNQLDWGNLYDHLMGEGEDGRHKVAHLTWTATAYEADVSRFNIAIIKTFICKWYAVKYGSKNGHQKYMCFIEIGLHAQNILTI